MPTCPTRHDDVVPDDTTTRLTWPEVADRLSPARIYWLHTTGPTGAPQVTAVWAVVAGDRVYLYSARSTVKARNLERDPRVAIHLESGSDVVIVYGVLTDLGTPGDWPAVVDAFADADARPRVVKLAVTHLPGSGTPDQLVNEVGIGVEHIAAAARELVARGPQIPVGVGAA